MTVLIQSYVIGGIYQLFQHSFKFRLLNNFSEINIVLGDFNLDALNPGLFEQISNTLSKLCLENSNSTHLNGSLIYQVYVREVFLDISREMFQISVCLLQIMMLCKCCSSQTNVWLEYSSAAVSHRTLLLFFIIVYALYTFLNKMKVGI